MKHSPQPQLGSLSKEGERPAAVLGDALAAIDAGVDELV